MKVYSFYIQERGNNEEKFPVIIAQNEQEAIKKLKEKYPNILKLKIRQIIECKE